MDDSFLLSIPTSLATTFKENNRARIELREHPVTGHSLAVDNIENRLIRNEAQSSTEIWKSFDGLHSLKSADTQNFTVCYQHTAAAHEQKKVVNQGQQCELSDLSATQQTKSTEGYVYRLTASHSSGKATILTEYVATLEEQAHA